jgi:hypothetical protein
MSKVKVIKSKDLPADVKRSLKLMIGYLAEQEESNFEEYLHELGKQTCGSFNVEQIKKLGNEARQHIYYHVCIVSEWFNED